MSEWSRARALLVVVASMVLLSWPTRICALEAPNHNPWRRWAVIASPEVRKSGIADLITAELFKTDEIELVERERLAEVLKEQEISVALAARDSKERVKLGQLIKADGLLIISRSTDAKQPYLRVVVSDTVYGIRLADDHILLKNKLKAAEQCAQRVHKTRKRLVGGIQKIYGVPQFVSKNLTTEFDYLRAGFGRLLANSLMTRPGVAVVELEEAQAIAKELELTGTDIGDRVVPFFVDGTFEVTRKTPSDLLRFRLSVVIRGKKSQPRTIVCKDVSLEEAAKKLTGDITDEIVRSSTKTPFSAEEQFKALITRADVMESSGNTIHSIELREAALVLKPGNREVRLSVCLSYARLLGQYRSLSHNTHRDILVEKKLEQGRKRGLDFFRRSASHIETLIRRREINPEEAGLQISSLNHQARGLLHGGQAAHREMRDLLQRVLPLLPNLDYKVGRVGRRHQQYSTAVDGKAKRSISKHDWVNRIAFVMIILYNDEQYLDELATFLVKYAPEDTPPLSRFVSDYESILAQDQYSKDALTRTEAIGQLRRFYKRLKTSKKPALVFSACHFLMRLDRAENPDQANAKMLIEAEELLKLAKKYGYPLEPKNVWGPDNRLYTSILAQRDEISQLVRPQQTQQTPRLPRKHKHHEPPRYYPPNVEPFDTNAGARLSFSQVGPLSASWSDIYQCDDATDLFWSKSGAYVMREKGKLEPRLTTDAKVAPLVNVHWDGKRFWLATQNDGIHLVSLDGREVAKITEKHGLPPFKSAVVHSLEPGKAIVAGGWGANYVPDASRAWIAIVDVREDQNKPKIEVILKATKSPNIRSGTSVHDLETAVSVIRMIPIPARSGEGQDLFCDRGLGYPPIRIDLTNMKVSAETPLLSGRWSRGSWFPTEDGRVVKSQRTTIIHRYVDRLTMCKPPTTKKAKWKLSKLGDVPIEKGRYLQPFSYKGSIYKPGHTWARFDLRTLKREQLTTRKLPAWQQYYKYSVSAHYGLVGWFRAPLSLNAWENRLFQVHIDHPDPPEPDRTLAFRNVPAEVREKHQKAVHAIMKLGGSVWSPKDRWWGSKVYLSEKWRGGGEGLKHLADVYNIGIIQIVKTPITDADLRHLENIPDLKQLFLVETKVTNKGLEQFKPLHNLYRLWLEGATVGDEFSDEGLSHLRNSKKMTSLTLYGPNFTDASIDTLLTLNRLYKLTLYDTKISQSGVAKLKKQKPKLRLTMEP